MDLEHSYQAINVVADACKADHGQQFIGRARCITAVPAYIDEQRGNDECVDEVDPGVRAFLNNADEGTVAVVHHHEDADEQEAGIDPGGTAGALKGDEEEGGGEDEYVAEGKDKMFVRVVGHFLIVDRIRVRSKYMVHRSVGFPHIRRCTIYFIGVFPS